jgi:hypothetical protein
MFSAVHPTTDIAKILRHVRFVANRRAEGKTVTGDLRSPVMKTWRN